LRLKGWGSPNSNEGTYTVVLYIYKYFVVLHDLAILELLFLAARWQVTRMTRSVSST
jgi:hypothetical protein